VNHIRPQFQAGLQQRDDQESQQLSYGTSWLASEDEMHRQALEER
jgi:hypothetical protein